MGSCLSLVLGALPPKKSEPNHHEIRIFKKKHFPVTLPSPFQEFRRPFRDYEAHTIRLMEEILHQLIGSLLSHYLQGCILPGGAGFLPSTISSREKNPFVDESGLSYDSPPSENQPWAS